MRGSSRNVVIGVLLGGLLGFGLGHYVIKPSKSAPPPTTVAITTTTIPQPSLTITPAAGPITTTFQLVAKNFSPGGVVKFKITFPNGKVFPPDPAPHGVAADGTVSTTFLATNGNPSGTYLVVATDNQGKTAQATFNVGIDAPETTTTAGRTTTTKKR